MPTGALIGGVVEGMQWLAELEQDVVEAQRPSRILGGEGRAVAWCLEAPVLMVGTDPLEVDRLLAGGELIDGVVARRRRHLQLDVEHVLARAEGEKNRNCSEDTEGCFQKNRRVEVFVRPDARAAAR